MAKSNGRSKLEQTVIRLRSVIAEAREHGENRLPPETELSPLLGVGRSTLREALALLAAEGLVDRAPRRGTIIRQTATPWGPATLSYPIHMILALPDFLKGAGIHYQIQKLAVTREPLDDEIRESLPGIQVDEVYRVTRVFEIDGRPAALLEHIIPTRIGDTDIDIESLREGATTFIEQITGVPLSSADNTITAEAASPELAEVFAIEVGTPMLVLYATLSAEGHGPVALGQIVFLPTTLSMSAHAVGHVAPQAI